MASLEDKKRARFELLHALYQATDGVESAMVGMYELSEKIGMSREVADNTMEYLVGEGLAEHRAYGGLIGITHYGVTNVEAALERPNEPTQYFPPVVNILHIGTMTGSTVQQAGHASVQSASVSPELQSELRAFLTRLEEALADSRLSHDILADVDANVATIRAQLQARAPKALVIKESLRTIRNALEGMAGSLAATGVLNVLPALIDKL